MARSLRFARVFPLLPLALLLPGCSMFGADGAGPAFAEVPPPPMTRTVAQTDELHGETIEDPYRWLEDQDDDEVQAWARAQQERTEAVLSKVPPREAIRRRLTELWSFEQRSTPEKKGGTWFWSAQTAEQDKPVYYAGSDPRKAPGEEGGPIVLLDPNETEDVSVGGVYPSPNGKYAAIALNDSGSDWQTWVVVRTADGTRLEDEVRWSKFSSAAWTHDEAGFFYQRYPEPAEGESLAAPNRNAKLCYHALGTSWSEDIVVYERPEQPTWGFAPEITEDGRTLVLAIWDGSDRRNRVGLIDLTANVPIAELPVAELLWRFDASWSFLGRAGKELLFLTDFDAPRQRIVAIDPGAPQPAESPAEGADWQPREVVPEGPDRVASAALAGGEIVVAVLKDASHRLVRYTLEGVRKGEIPLPGLGAVSEISGKRDLQELWFRYESFLVPPTLYAYDLGKNKLEEVFRPDLPLTEDGVLVSQPSFPAHDGTRLVAFLAHRDDLVLDGRNEAWLYGYGGFDISLTPRYQPDIVVWVERGGVYMQPTLRGGGEFGEEWHAAGMLERKQNVFEDLYSSADYLIRNSYTSSDRLGVSGRSNGGLLAAAALTQRPDLFGAAVPEVGVLDMLRYHLFTIGAAWIPEYGDPDDAEACRWLRAYSPLHNLEAGTDYPPTMVMTSDHDDRVVPAHSFKFAAAMQSLDGVDAPVLLRVTQSQGHGAGKPRSVLVAEATDRLTFLDWALSQSAARDEQQDD
jgi:prolyl oligopeptidase